MFKLILNFIFFFLMSISFSCAKENNIDVKLRSEYGQDLTHAPFFLRFSFEKAYNIDWKASAYAQRRAFLKEYETSLEAEQSEEQAEAKALADKEREQTLQAKEDQRAERDKLRAQLAEEKAKEKEEEAPQKAMDQLIKQQEEQLRQMERAATQGNR